MKSCSKIMAAVHVGMAGDRKTFLNYYRFPCRVFARAFAAEQSICGSVSEWGGWSVAMATPLLYVCACCRTEPSLLRILPPLVFVTLKSEQAIGALDRNSVIVLCWMWKTVDRVNERFTVETLH